MTIRVEEITPHHLRYFEDEVFLGKLLGEPDRLGEIDLTRWVFLPSPQSGLTKNLRFRLADRERNHLQVIRYLEARD